MNHNQRIIKAGGACGVLGILIYIILALSDPYIGPQTKTPQEFLAAWGTPKYVAVNMAIHFLLAGAAVLWIVSFVGINRLLGWDGPSLIVQIDVATPKFREGVWWNWNRVVWTCGCNKSSQCSRSSGIRLWTYRCTLGARCLHPDA